jgi:excisionase family DNA binding protein
MLTAKDLAHRWGISLPTIYKLFSSGALPGLRISAKNIRFREEDVIAYENSTWNQSTASSSTGESTPSTGETTEDDPSVARLVRQMERVLNEDFQSSSGSLSFGGVPVITR